MKNFKTFFLAIIAFVLISCCNAQRKNVDLESVNTNHDSLTENVVPFGKDSIDIIDNDKDTTLYDPPSYTPFFINEKEYFDKNNKYKNWDIKDRKIVFLQGNVEKDGSLSSLYLVKSCGIEVLDNEAYRLVQEADLDPGRDAGGEPVRCKCTFAIRFPPL